MFKEGARMTRTCSMPSCANAFWRSVSFCAMVPVSIIMFRLSK
ncbi:Uncharacterised protein [Vibrio cholerae]|nr:Uncharacterised protein [Vibrio cholerae]CSI57298.1 Uncharacterised protein [Vibrio cholerae]